MRSSTSADFVVQSKAAGVALAAGLGEVIAEGDAVAFWLSPVEFMQAVIRQATARQRNRMVRTSLRLAFFMEFNLPCDSYCAQGFPFLITFSAFSEKIRRQKNRGENPPRKSSRGPQPSRISKKKDFESEGGRILFVWHILPGMKQHRKDIMATPHK